MATISPPRPPAPPRIGPSERPPETRRTHRRWERPAARAAATDDLATVCLIGVTTAVGLALSRLFTDWTFAPYVVGAAILGHGTAWLLRRLDVGLTVASAVASVGSAIIATWLVLPTETTFGVITPHTLDVLSSELATARAVFHEAVAPVAPLPGFLLAACFGIALVAFLSDWAAFRMRATFEAVVPALALFIVTAIWGTPSHRTATVAALAVASLVFLVVHRASLDAERGAWFSGSGEGTLPNLLVTGAAIGGIALLGGIVLGPHLPGASAKPIYSPMGDRGGERGSRSRSTISPLVDIQPRVLDPSPTPVFQVKASKDSYWRLTSLDSYDGTIWSSNERYRSVKSTLADSSDLIGQPVEQDVTISSLSSIWLPAAYQPQKITGIEDISYSSRSGSLISQKDTSDGLTYHVTSVVADLSPELLRSATAGTAGGLGDELARYTVKPTVNRSVLQLTQRLTANQPTAYDKVIALQNHLRTFTYDDRVTFGHSTDALTTFLFNARRGYCQQFSAALAVMARLIGLPSRVAVGFRPGELAAGGTFNVRNKDAHAWPEIFFDRIGWVAFEPTPNSRNGLAQGNPAAASYTNVPYTRAAGGSDASDPGTGPGQAAPTTTAAVAPTTTLPKDDPEQAAIEQQTNDDPGVAAYLFWIFGAILAVAAVTGLVVWGCWSIAERRRRQRREAATTAPQRIALAWQEAEEAIGLARVTRRSTTTVDEWLERLTRPAGGAASAGVERGSAGHAALVRLGAAVVDAAYGPSVGDAAARQAEEDRATVVGAAHTAAGTWTVLRWQLDPRPSIAEWRAARLAGRRAAQKRPLPG